MQDSYTTSSQRWQAVQSRNNGATSSFVYSVKTTGIYCRPDCKARLARRSNVEFYDNAAEAVRMGFRPCKRCRPDLTSWDPQTQIVVRACEVIRRSREEGKEIGLLELAQQVGMTKSHFHRVFKKATGVTPREWGNQVQGEVVSVSVLDTFKVHAPCLSTLRTGDDLYESVETPDFEIGALDDGGSCSPIDIGDVVPLGTTEDISVQALQSVSLTEFPGSPSNLQFDVRSQILGSVEPYCPVLYREIQPVNLHFLHSQATPTPSFGHQELMVTPFASRSTNPIELSEYPELVYYTVRLTSLGYVIIAFRVGRVSMLQMSMSADELLPELKKRFPIPNYVCDSLDRADRVNDHVWEKLRYENTYRPQIEAILEALERPTGKVVNAFFDL